MSGAPIVSTYSMWSLFRNCRKAVEWRYLEQLIPLQRDRNLHFGSLIHECLQSWHEHRDLADALALIDRLCPSRLQDETQRRDWHLAIAMIKAYTTRYATEEFETIALERNFDKWSHCQSRYRRGVTQLCAGRQSGWHCPHRRRLLRPRTQDRLPAGFGLPRAPVDRLPDHHLLLLRRADDGHPDHRDLLQRAGEVETPAEQRGDRAGIPGPARGTVGEVENRQEHGEAPDAGDG